MVGESVMSEATASITVQTRTARKNQALENPGRGFANALLLALPLWGVIGAAIWALA